MSELTTVVTENGYVPLSQELQEELGIQAGTRLALRVEDGCLVVQPLLVKGLQTLQDLFVPDRDLVQNLKRKRSESNFEQTFHEKLERFRDLVASGPGLTETLMQFKHDEAEHEKRKQR